MKHPLLQIVTRLALGLAGAALIVSCASPVEKRITRNPQLYNSLNTSDQTLVSQGRIREGLTKEGVFLAWGRADRISKGSQKGVATEKWIYLGAQPVYTQNLGFGWGGGVGRWGGPFGYGYGGAWDPYWGGGFGPSVTYIPYKAATVDFKGNRVIGYEGPAR